MPDEKITAVIPLRSYDVDRCLFMATKKGLVKKTSILEYANIRKTGIQAIVLREDDELIEVKSTNKEKEIFLVTKKGQCIRFDENDVRPTGRATMGVIGVNLSEDDSVIGMQLHTQGEALLFVSERGMGKRTSLDEFSVQHRGGKGVRCYKITDKTGDLVGVKAVNPENEVMIITTEGIIIRIEVDGISMLGRSTSGVKLMNLKDDSISVAGMAKVREKMNSEEVVSELEKELEAEAKDGGKVIEVIEEDDDEIIIAEPEPGIE
jgi:DNA gyrase subunit A